jgi:UDP-N-acetylglucosamine/UDP-N-acetylgalactosamine diphosphorylase
MLNIPDDLVQKLRAHGQDHVIAAWGRLDDSQRRALLAQLQQIDLKELEQLYARREQKDVLPSRERIAPMPQVELSTAERQDYRERGVAAFRAGEVAYLLVAGGQGTRLGFDSPKGTFPIGPVSNKPLFQIHAEKVLALRRRFGVPTPLMIMTSPATDEPTRRFFAEHQNFGLHADEVWYFCQGTMPALDLATGRLLFDAPGRLSLSPNGHGGTLTGLKDSGLLDRLEDFGIKTISYFQVDNPLIKLVDFLFVGRHLGEGAEVSSKVLPKTGPKEKVGNFVLVDGRCSMIEYSDLPEEWAVQTDDRGRLEFWAGNPAIHLFDVAFLRHLTRDADSLPWHVARKKVPHVSDSGELVSPTKENALKFERFIFDVLPQAEQWTILPTAREEEFAPVKNAEGVDSPASCRRLMCNLAAAWLKEAGVEIPTDAEGNAQIPVEICPLFALEPEELREKVKGLPRIEKKTFLG